VGAGVGRLVWVGNGVIEGARVNVGRGVRVGGLLGVSVGALELLMHPAISNANRNTTR